MSAINIISVNVLDNPSYFQNPLQLEIQYECLYPLQHGKLCVYRCSCLVAGRRTNIMILLAIGTDLEWKLIYVGSPESEKYDQVLDSVLVGPVAPGSYRFVFQVRGTSSVAVSASWQLLSPLGFAVQADPPNPRQLPQDDIVGVTVMLLTCSYNQQASIMMHVCLYAACPAQEMTEMFAMPRSSIAIFLGDTVSLCCRSSCELAIMLVLIIMRSSTERWRLHPTHL